MPLKWTDPADADLEKIESYIAKENSALVAIDVVLGIIDLVGLILPDHPRAGRQGRVQGTRELVVDGLPFIVVYREAPAGGHIELLRVLHESQQWPAN